jgi:DNA-binding GntR family transcriptional regulator
VSRVTVDHRNPEPLFSQLAAILRERIASGEFGDGPLPSNRTLRETYDIGEYAVTHALKVLVDEGLIYSVPRRGYYVRRLALDFLTPTRGCRIMSSATGYS